MFAAIPRDNGGVPMETGHLCYLVGVRQIPELLGLGGGIPRPGQSGESLA